MSGDMVEVGMVRVELDAEETLAWWRPLAQAVLAVPHLLWTGVLTAASIGLAVVGALSVLLVGRLPRWLVAFHVLTLRERVRCYSYWFALRTGVPPMAFARRLDDPGDDPRVRVDCVP